MNPGHGWPVCDCLFFHKKESNCFEKKKIKPGDGGMVGQKGAALQVLKWEHPNQTVRLSTIQCGLTRTLKQHLHGLLPWFQKASHVIGQYVYIVGLASNWLLIHEPNIQITDWKHFYDQIFSAVEINAAIMSLKRQSNVDDADGSDKLFRNQYGTRIKEFMTGIKSLLPAKVDFEMRQEQAAEMAESAMLHLKQFPTRLQAYLKYRFIDLQLQRTGKIHCKSITGTVMYNSILSATVDPISSFLKTLKLDTEQTQTLLSLAREVIDAETQALRGCKLPKDDRDKDGMSKKVLFTFLPHLQRYSNWNLEWWSRYTATRSTWTSESVPEPFSLLPVFKLQPRHVHYTWSQFEAFLGWTKRLADVNSGLVKDVRKINDADMQRKKLKSDRINKEWNGIMTKRLSQKYKNTEAGKKRKRHDEAVVQGIVCKS